MITNFESDACVNADAVAALYQHAGKIEETLKPFGVTLSSEERKKLPKLGKSRDPFVGSVAEALDVMPELLPFGGADTLKAHYQAARDLRKFREYMESLVLHLKDIEYYSSQKAYGPAMDCYTAVKRAAMRNIPGAERIWKKLASMMANLGKQPASRRLAKTAALEAAADSLSHEEGPPEAVTEPIL
jgi:hypothetical protein